MTGDKLSSEQRVLENVTAAHLVEHLAYRIRELELMFTLCRSYLTPGQLEQIIKVQDHWREALEQPTIVPADDVCPPHRFDFQEKRNAHAITGYVHRVPRTP